VPSRSNLTVLSLVAVVLLTAPSVGARTTAKPSPLATGKQLYRLYCGACHQLENCLCAGFGRDASLGPWGGPSFHDVRVPYSLTIAEILGASEGHERVSKLLTVAEVKTLARFLALATRNGAPVLRRSYD
jgi:mono/diheme cytochrome c family protein